jgi:hypothetical protein
MAYDKVTKINTIAKRKAYSKVNEGVLTEHRNAFGRNEPTVLCRDTARQLTVIVHKSGKMRRLPMNIGSGNIITNYARGTSARPR